MTTLIDIHFELITRLGLHFEFNAQNLFLGLDKTHHPVSIVLRDMMDVEKDVAIRGKLGLHTDFSSHPYHVIPDDNLLFCQMRHSFLFDFKLSTYVIEPLLNAASNLGVLCKEEAIKKLAEHTAAWRAALPPDYFPAGNSWYCYDRVLIDKAKLHVRKLDPLLR